MWLLILLTIHGEMRVVAEMPRERCAMVAEIENRFIRLNGGVHWCQPRRTPHE